MKFLRELFNRPGKPTPRLMGEELLAEVMKTPGECDVQKALALISGGAELYDIRSLYGRNALGWAAYNGHSEIALALIGNGAVLDLRDTNGRTALHLAAMRGCDLIAAALIDKGAWLDAVDWSYGEYTPRMLAEHYQMTGIVKLIDDKKKQSIRLTEEIQLLRQLMAPPAVKSRRS